MHMLRLANLNPRPDWALDFPPPMVAAVVENSFLSHPYIAARNEKGTFIHSSETIAKILQ